MLLVFITAVTEFSVWKRDLREAFCGCPIFHSHTHMAWVIWLHQGELWAARHTGMPFRTAFAVHAFHRLGAFLSRAAKVAFKTPVGRDVDDLFGASCRGV